MTRFLIAILLIAWLPVNSQDVEVKVTEVSVWVKATDRSGKPLAGLTGADFEIFEDGKKMTPTCFEEFLHSGGSSVSQTQQVSPAKRLVLILDLYIMQQ